MKFTYNATLRRVWIFAHWTISDGDAVQSTSTTLSCTRYVTRCYTVITVCYYIAVGRVAQSV